ncbi:MAG: hypothetical protein RLZZ303_1634 [Candidatus Hydrogenedentota bacterium]|jgi:hypothetical protein
MIRVLALLLATLPAIAQEAPPLVAAMPAQAWLAGLVSDDPARRDAAQAQPPTLDPGDAVAFVGALLHAEAEVRWVAMRALAAHTAAVAGQGDTARASAWGEALLALDDAVKQAMPAPFTFEVEPPLGLLESFVEAQRAAATIPDNAPLVQLIEVTRAEIIRLVGQVLPAPEWPRIEPRYVEPALRTAVIDAGAAMRGASFRAFVETRLLSSDPAEVLALLPALVLAYPDNSRPIVADLARNTTQPEVFWACLEHLAAWGELPSAVSAPRPDWGAEDSRRYATLTLQAAHALAAQGDCGRAMRVFSDVAERNLSGALVRSALEGIARCDAPRLYRAALGYINDPALRSVVIHLLARHLDDEASRQLRQVYDSQPPLTQSALIQVFALRNLDEARPLLQSALASSHVAVRYAAAIALGEDPAEEDLWTLAAAPPEWLQQEALRDYLALADARAARGETATARQQYLALLQGGLPVEVERLAVEGLGRVGDPGDKAVLDALTSEPALRGVSEQARVMLASRSGDPADKADAVGKLSGEHVPQEEMDQLVAQVPDRDARKALLERSGFLADGLLLGPLTLAPGMGVAQPHFPLIPFPLPDPMPAEGAAHAWQPLASCESGARFDLAVCLAPKEEPTPEDTPLAPVETDADAAPEEVCAYLSAELRLPQLTAVEFHLHHDDGFALWINGKFQRAEDAPEDAAPRWTRFPLVLEPGLSYLVLKLPQRQGPWMTGLRIVTRDGQPLDLTQQRMPEDRFKPVGLDSGDARLRLDSTL